MTVIHASLSVPSFRKRLVKRWATIWTIVRQDNVQFRFTDHNAKIYVKLTDETWEPVIGVDASAITAETGLRNRNMEMLGTFSSSAITDDDLAAGLYNKAEISVLLYDWMFPWAGSLESVKYRIRRTAWDGQHWRAEVAGITGLINQPVGETYTRSCKYDLFDTRCGLSQAAHKRASATVTQVTDRTKFRITTVPSTASATEPAVADNHFNQGKVQWIGTKTSSQHLNTGIRCEIKKYTHSTKEFELYEPAPFNITVNDTFDLWAGCDKRYETCRDKFSNITRFGGFFFIPDADEMRRVPRRHA